MDLLATDPGAWNIIGWMLLLAACGAVILWAVSTLLLRGGRTSKPPSTPTESSSR